MKDDYATRMNLETGVMESVSCHFTRAKEYLTFEGREDAMDVSASAGLLSERAASDPPWIELAPASHEVRELIQRSRGKPTPTDDEAVFGNIDGLYGETKIAGLERAKGSKQPPEPSQYVGSVLKIMHCREMTDKDWAVPVRADASFIDTKSIFLERSKKPAEDDVSIYLVDGDPTPVIPAATCKQELESVEIDYRSLREYGSATVFSRLIWETSKI